ncbi:hypothetical protein STEG23_032990 [Scotinomys teguina]
MGGRGSGESEAVWSEKRKDASPPGREDVGLLAARPEYHNIEEREEIDLKNKFMKMIEAFKDEMKNSLKDIEKKINKNRKKSINPLKEAKKIKKKQLKRLFQLYYLLWYQDPECSVGSSISALFPHHPKPHLSQKAYQAAKQQVLPILQGNMFICVTRIEYVLLRKVFPRLNKFGLRVSKLLHSVSLVQLSGFGQLRMALMAGTARRHSSALEGEASWTPRARDRDNSSTLKVSQTPGSAWHSSYDCICEETQFSPEGRGIPNTWSCFSGQWLCPEDVLDTWELSDFLGKSGLELLHREGYPDCSEKSGLELPGAL